MNEEKNFELVYHFLKKDGVKYEDLIAIKHKEKEFRGVEITGLSQYHVKLEHTDDFVLCQFLDRMKALEKREKNNCQ